MILDLLLITLIIVFIIDISGVIDSRVIALGGVTFDRIDYLKELNFGGVAMSGAIYSVEAVDGLKSACMSAWHQ